MRAQAMAPVSVLHVITGLAVGGAETMLLRLIGGADKAAFSHAVLALGPDGVIADELRRLEVPVLVLRLDTWSGRLRFALRAREFVSGYRPDVIQGWMYHGNLAAYALRRPLAPSSRLLWNIRQCLYDMNAEKPMTRSVIRAGARVSGAAQHIIYNSRLSSVQHGQLGFMDQRAIVIPNGFDTSRYIPDEARRSRAREALGIRSDELVIGTVGRNHPVKDHQTLLAACAMVAGAGIQARFLIAGPGCGPANESLKRLAEDYGLHDKVILCDQWNDTAALYPAFDIFCLTSKSEGFPNVLGEAMSCGVPCVATDVGDCAVLMGQCGSTVAHSSPEDLARALLHLASMAERERRFLGMKGREHICREYELTFAVKRYEALYRRADVSVNSSS